MQIEGLKTPVAKLMPISLPVVIYGAGNTGRQVVAYLRNWNREISAFIDAGANPGSWVDGIPVWRLDEFVGQNTVADYALIVAIHNRDNAIAPIIKNLEGYGFQRVLTMVDFVNLYPHHQPFRYWLSGMEIYEREREQIALMVDLMADEKSRQCVQEIIRCRRSGNFFDLSQPSIEDQYIPEGLPRWRNPMRLIDCGAYNGDTLALFQQAGYKLNAVVAFEPDAENFQSLTARFSHLSGNFFSYGLSDRACVMGFNPNAGEACRLDSHGSTSIQCVAIDEVVPDFAPTLIKMDIEGAEIAALKGAEKTIRKYRPGLAISLYHNPADLWHIPLLIHGWNLGYQFYVRCHRYNTFDCVLYAYVPEGSKK